MNNDQNNMAEFVWQAHDVDYDSEYANFDEDIISQPDLDDEGNLMSELDIGRPDWKSTWYPRLVWPQMPHGRDPISSWDEIRFAWFISYISEG